LVDLEPLRALAHEGDGRDRAYVDAMMRIAWSRASDPAERAAIEEVHRALGAASRKAHAAIRGEIASGALRGAELRRKLEAAPLLERDHFVEEVLGIAYPPLEETKVAPEVVGYAPSGYDEIVHALDVTQLGSGDRFLDIGSGTGKAVLLAALLTGASSAGIEREATLHDLAVAGARDLSLERPRFICGDAREAALDDTDVFFMYLPFTGGVLDAVMSRLSEVVARRPREARRPFLCAGALEEKRFVDLVPVGPTRSWLHVYAWR
jgi:hypothetical protein